MGLIRSAKFFAVTAFLGFATLAQAQQGSTITGRVVSERGQPLPAANVFINELNISVGTNAAGNYTITIPQARLGGQTVILRARAIGYTPQSQQIRVSPGSQTVNFELRRELTQLSEVVVTGVATATEQRKLAFTVTRVDSSMMPVAGSNPVSQLQGKVPGAMIVSASGRPGSAPSVILRGPVSLNATGRTQQPLYLLDGIPLQGALPDINPDDIESIEVVKGAAAASVYGARAGAGVINITTKTGRTAQQGIRFGFRTEAGASDIERRFPIATNTALALDWTGRRFCSREILGGAAANSYVSIGGACNRYIDWDREVQRINNNGAEDFSRSAQSFLGDAGFSAVPGSEGLTGWFMATPWPELRDPVRQVTTSNAFMNTNLDLRGRVNNTGVYASVSNLVQEGAVRNLRGFVRNSARVNLDQNFSTRLRGNINTFYSQSVDHGSNLDEVSSVWFALTRTCAMCDVLARDETGRIVVRDNMLAEGNANGNPMYPVVNNNRTDRQQRFVGGASLRYNPVDWITLDGNFGYDRSMGTALLFRDRGYRTTTNSPATNTGFIFEADADNSQWSSSISAAATRTFFDDINATFTTRYVYSDQTLSGTSHQGQTLIVPGLVTSDAATSNFFIGSDRQAIRDMAFFNGLDFDIKDRYILGGLIRRDGSSLFGSGNRWQTFGRVSAAWLASSESWWPLPEAVSLFKLRAARGSTGQRPRFNAQYETYTIGTGGQLNPATTGNRFLKPEINTETEVGGDFEFFRRYGLSISYAKARIDGQMLQARPPTSTGFQAQWQNAGEITNTTWEGTLTMPILTRGALNWTSRIIYDQTRSDITRLDIPDFIATVTPNGANQFDILRFKEGDRIGNVLGFTFLTNCGQLPSDFQSQCSMSGTDLAAAYRPNSDGYIVWVGEGNQQSEGITRNLWRSFIPRGEGPWGNQVHWGNPLILRDSVGTVVYDNIGNGLPKYHWGYSHNLDWRRLSLYGLLDAMIGQKAWNASYHWAFGDLQNAEVDQFNKSVEEARPIGYYWRRGPSASPGGDVGAGGLYDVLRPSNHTFEDASYVKLRELAAHYRLGAIGGRGDWRVGLVGRNLKTWTDWRGFDPEGGNTTGPFNSSILTPVIGFRFPNHRTFTLQLSSTF